MPWQPVTFTPPAAVGSITTSAQAVTTAAPGALAAASARLGAAPAPAYALSPLAASAAPAGALATALAGLVQQTHRFVLVHPWQQGVGTGDGLYRYLSAPNALQALASKLTDTADPHRPAGNLEAVALLVGANSYIDLARQLALLNGVLPLPETRMAQRRAAALADWERQKLVLPHTAQNARWSVRQHSQQSTLRAVQVSAGDLVADLAGYDAENVSPVAELQALAAKKQGAITAHVNAMAALTATFTGGAGFAITAGNTIPEIAAAITGVGGPGHENTLCVACLFLAAPGELDLLKQVVGL